MSRRRSCIIRSRIQTQPATVVAHRMPATLTLEMTAFKRYTIKPWQSFKQFSVKDYHFRYLFSLLKRMLNMPLRFF